MTVSPYPKDADATLLASNITALQAQLAKTTGSAAVNAINTTIAQLQTELVYHYMAHGRLTAANILSTMT